MSRKPFIAGNWKMYKTIAEGLSFSDEFRKLVSDVKDRDMLICAPFTLLQPLAQAFKGSNIKLGAQNMYFEKEGAFTGEISPLQVLDAGAAYVLLGHSERRHVFGEKDSLINKKMISALAAGLLPVLCVGELLEEREKGKTEEVVKTQVMEGFKNIDKETARKVTIAYEPVWAIGTGKTATPEDADSVHAYIRKVLTEVYGSEFALSMRIQYGGSVKAENIDTLMAKENIDGALVGGASLKAETFARIVKFQK
ncbi:MAG: triose-phosphate isomerase [Brevinematales bacterium]|jgi:triosephosphate isomerase